MAQAVQLGCIMLEGQPAREGGGHFMHSARGRGALHAHTTGGRGSTVCGVGSTVCTPQVVYTGQNCVPPPPLVPPDLLACFRQPPIHMKLPPLPLPPAPPLAPLPLHPACRFKLQHTRTLPPPPPPAPLPSALPAYLEQYPHAHTCVPHTRPSAPPTCQGNRQSQPRAPPLL